MPETPAEFVILIIVISSLLILGLVSFISLIVFRYQQKQNKYLKHLEEIKVNHENILLHSQIEIQEKTFQNISLEIHDNIGQKLAFAKLLLNTLPYSDAVKLIDQVETSIGILGDVVVELSSLSRGLSSELVLQNGLIKATQNELAQIRKTSSYEVSFTVAGDTIFLSGQRELVLFRVIQEALHNIIKHADATRIDILIEFGESQLILDISDNGRGFDVPNVNCEGTGIRNIRKRVGSLGGFFSVDS
ncbi:MAG: hypothetical protein EOO43_20775, partial [Flavobacterium sp.]